ncbi:MAG: dihydropteroate synthase [Deltaproteobacteria bacterium HGW-Deltaproteobacteria-10]|nr:MAG: dihydropteroate synthase [Deltaproteobacteria bacterium HGW-Deltaproteobacteria-10]
MKIINIRDSAQGKAIFKKIGVDPYGIEAMLPKTININILLENKSCRIANIIKQEMLSVGGDAAVARGSVGNSVASTDILIMGTIKQITALSRKLALQPFGLKQISQDILAVINNTLQKEFILKTSRREIKLGHKTQIMGILNVTPDSFSDGGLFYNQQKAIDHGLQMVSQGADIIDVGGESTRPGAAAVSAKEELKRVLPVICGITRQVKIPISIDTTKAAVAREAMAAGAEIVNDVSAGYSDKKMLQTVREGRAAMILMHMRGKPQTMQKGNLIYSNLMGEIIDYLRKSIEKAMVAGIEKQSLVIDPGIGFGKMLEDNYRIINNLAELKTLGLPIMIGTSRKAFIGKITGDEPKARIEGTAATVVASIMNGCHIVRVHDVVEMKKIAAVTDAILHA